MLIALLLVTLSICLLVFSLFLFQQRGPIPTTLYMLASKEEREKMKTKAEYRFVGTVVLMLSFAFLLSAIAVWFSISWLYKVVLVICVVLVTYTIATTIRAEIKH